MKPTVALQLPVFVLRICKVNRSLPYLAGYEKLIALIQSIQLYSRCAGWTLSPAKDMESLQAYQIYRAANRISKQRFVRPLY